MPEYEYAAYNFENPSPLYVVEDYLKWFIGVPLMYSKYHRTFGLKGNERVLDFGCGGGAGSLSLLKLLGSEGHVTCVDLSDYRVMKARKRLRKYPNAECVAGDIRELDFPVSSFDVISMHHVLHDVLPEIRRETVDTLVSLLKPDGRLFMREPVKQSHGMPTDEIRTLMQNADLKEIQHKETKSIYTGIYNKND